MLLFKPLPGLFGGDEVAGLEFGSEFLHDRGIHSSGAAFPRTGLVAFEQGLQPALAHRREPAEKVAARNAAEVRHFRGGVLPAGGELGAGS